MKSGATKMGTKAKPGKFDCYKNLEDDEPYFVLAARDPAFRDTVQKWIDRRREIRSTGDKDISEDQLREASHIMDDADSWRLTVYEPRKIRATKLAETFMAIDGEEALDAINKYFQGEGKMSIDMADLGTIIAALKQSIKL